jgi:hypothetical protein
MVIVPEVLEDQVVLFVDLLGFSESTFRLDANLQASVLALLTNIASLKSDFVSTTTKQENGTTHNVRPSISTFSDHIVASYSLARIEAEENIKPLIVMAHLSGLVSSIALRALSIGFLTRGGVATGKLYHSGGVVFGEALVEAVALENRTAIYPRVVLSAQAGLFFNSRNYGWTTEDFDGIHYIDYYRDCVLKAVPPGDGYAKGTEHWFMHAANVLEQNLSKLKDSKHTNERAKWVYFVRKLHEALSKLNPDLLKAFGIDPTLLPKVS